MRGSLLEGLFVFVTDRVWASSLKRSFLKRASRSHAETDYIMEWLIDPWINIGKSMKSWRGN